MNIYDDNFMDEELIFDENGYVISSISQSEITEKDEQDASLNNGNQPTIFFTTITPTGRIISKMMEWEVQEHDQGLFFIYNTMSDILDDVLSVVDSDNQVIWESEIRSLPANSFNLINVECEEVYITKKVLRASDMPKSEAPYGIKLKSYEDCLMYLKVSNLPKFSDEDKLDDAFGIPDVSEDEMTLENTEETLEEPIVEEFSDTEVSETNIISFDFLNACSQIQEEVVNLDESELEMALFTDESTDQSSNVQHLQPIDMKSYLMSQMLAYAPINIDYRLCEDAIDIKQSIVIEKMGNYFIVVLNGFSNKPTYLLDGDEIYFKADLTVEEFLQKIQKRICRMYGLSIDEFNSIDKVLVIDELERINVNSMDANIRIYTRTRLLPIGANMGEYILVDLTYRALQITFKDESNNIFNMSNEALGLNQGIHVLEQISSIIRGIQYKPILYTGLFIDDAISTQVSNEMNNQNMVSLAKYMSSIA